MSYNQNMAIGVDIGGTNIKIGLISEHGHIAEFQSVGLQKSNDNRADISFISEAIQSFINKYKASHQLMGIGVASPGILDSKRGIVNYAMNLGWENLTLASRLEDSLQLEVHLVSDSVAGAIGERYYAAAGLSDFLYICIGTGVGASLVTNHAFFRGTNGEAMDIGHTSIIHDGPACKCGNRGCLENYISAAALTERIRTEIATTRSLLSSYASIHEIDTIDLYHAAQKGDDYALKLFQDAGRLLGIAIVNCVQLFGVPNIIVGGGVSQAGNYLLDPARSEVSMRLGQRAKGIQVIQAGMPTKSGVIGAASCVYHSIRVSS